MRLQMKSNRHIASSLRGVIQMSNYVMKIEDWNTKEFVAMYLPLRKPINA